VHRSGGGGGYPRRILIAVAAAVIPMIAGCEAGTSAPSLQWHQPTDGTYHAIGNITISNAFVLGAPIGASLAVGQNAGLFLGLVNTGTPDRLLSISAPGVAQSVLLPGGQIPLPNQHAVLLTGPRPTVILQHLLHPLPRPKNPSSVITITLTFAVAGQVTIKVPVIPRANFYATLFPAPTPTTPSPKPPTPTATPGSSASPSGSASPSPSAS
jgi:copper(I)-binding protein